jgi:hypothetical protein
LNQKEIDTVSRLVADQLEDFRTKSAAPAVPAFGPVTVLTKSSADQLFASITGYVKRNILALDARLKVLEAARTTHFEGPYDPAKSYKSGALVQRQGKTWVALVDTSGETPGSSAHWKVWL